MRTRKTTCRANSEDFVSLDTVDGTVLVEIRSTGLQTVFPPSVHPSGEQVGWEGSGDPSDVPASDLHKAVAKLASASLLALAWPEEGSRQDTALALAGCLLRGGWTTDEAERFIGLVAHAAGDEEHGKRRLVVEHTAQRLVSGEDVTGWPRLAELIGDDVADRVWRWMELRGTVTAGVPREANEGKPMILVEGGDLPEIVDQAEAALLANAADPIFQRGALLVRPVRASPSTMREIYRQTPGVLVLSVIDVPYLTEKFTRVATWIKQTKDGLKQIDCPARVARTYLARAGDWKLPTLLGIIEAPTLRPDGSLLSKPGYDEATCLFLDPGGVEFPPIPDHPSRDDAVAAIAELQEVLKDFPWVAASDRSAALAAVFTGLIRHSLRAAPLTAFRAPKMASGKSLLADIVAMIATGRVASVMSQGKDEDEEKKRLLAILVEGISVACIDNIERPFGGAALCSVLTQESWRDRILGRTGTATVPTTTTWLATGNNLCFTGDITTRVVVSDLDPKCEKPEERRFEVNLYEWTPQNRPRLVAAALTVLRAYHVAGRPPQDLSVFGRFEDWSCWIRSALVWCGEADPCEGRKRIEDTDPVRRQLRMVLIAWKAAFGTTSKTAAEAIKAPGTGADLKEAFMEVAAGRDGEPDPRRLGNYLSKYECRPEGGLRFERVGERQGVALWRCVPIEGSPAGVTDRARPEGFVGFVGPSDQAEICIQASWDRPSLGVPPDEIRLGETDPPNPPNPPEDPEEMSFGEFCGEGAGSWGPH
jgi:hypothetical protein